MIIKYTLFVIVVIAMLSIAFGAYLGVELTQEDPGESYQAALHINNWTNRTLDIDIYVFAADTVLYSITLEHGANVTIIVTWQDVKETITLLHCVNGDVDGWAVYNLHPGEWEAIILW